jgi:thioesterase domain-containing protein/acyl carrier protein
MTLRDIGLDDAGPQALAPVEPLPSAGADAADSVGEALVFPCSSSQQRCWFIDALNPGNPALNVALRWEIKGRFSESAVERAFQTIVDRHEILRTRFFEKDGEPMQESLPHFAFKLAVVDLTILPEADRLDEAMALGHQEAHRPMDIARLPLIRATLLRLSADHAILLATVHQIVFDGWSIRVLAHEFGVIASAFDDKRGFDLPEPPLQYGDYCLWQKEYFASAGFAAEIAYWKSKLAGAPYFEIAPDRARPARPSYRGEILAAILPQALGERLEEAARKHNLTLFSFGCAVTGAMLHRYSGATDVIFGTQIAGRDDQDLEPMIGIFINNLVMRFDASGDPTFETFLSRVNETVQEALIHQRMPFHKLVELLNPPRDASRTPLISINFTVLRDVMEHQTYGGFDLIGQPSLSAGSLYDLNFFMVHWPNGWRMAMEFNPDLFERRTAEAMLAFLMATFEFAVARPGERLSALVPPRRDAIAPSNGEFFAAIETLLLAHPDVGEAAVAPRGETCYAYVTPAPGTSAPLETLPGALMAHLAASLPADRRPGGISLLLALPRMADGGVDLRALPAPPSPTVPALAVPGSGRAPDAVEARLGAIWRDVLGVAVIRSESNFFELGGHSLLAIRLIGRISGAFGVKIDVASLFQAPTLGQFAAYLASLGAARSAVGAARLVEIQPEGDKTPIIAINNSMLYYALAKQIGADRPFLGIPLLEPEGPLPSPPRDLMDIAGDYVREIRRAQPRGPYILCGLCVAGAIAYEAARQLVEAGEQVPLVILSDMWAPGYLKGLSFPRRLVYHVYYHLHVLRHRIGLVRRGAAPLAEVLASYTLIRKSRILDLAARLRLIGDLPVEKADRENWLFLRSLEWARNQYQAPEAVGEVVILQSAEIVTRFADPAMGWAGRAKGRLHIHAIPGWHEDMFQNEGAVLIAGHLRPLLEAVDAMRPRSSR